jgi:hypothetical protein
LSLRRIAAKNKISIFPVGVGRKNGTAVTSAKWRFRSEFVPDVLEKIARTTGGAYSHIDDTDAAKTLPSRIAAAVGAHDSEEITAVFAALAAVLLVVGGSLSAVRSTI